MSEVDELRAEVEQLRMENRELVESLGRVAVERDAFKTERNELRAAQAEHDLLTISGVEDLANKLARTEDEVERLTVERDALSARLQAVRELLDEAGNEKSQPSEPESMRWHVPGDDLMNSIEDIAHKIVAWVNANGGEARYEPERGSYEVAGRTDTEIGFTERVDGSHIAVRTSQGWAYAKPGDRIVMGDTSVHVRGRYGDNLEVRREFTVSPVESSGSAE